MAEFFENLEKAFSETAEVVTKKAGEVIEVVTKKTEQTVETQKIKGKINAAERENERDIKSIGKLVYSRFKKGEMPDAQLTKLCEAIAEREALIAGYQEDIADIKGMEVCANCGAHIEPQAKYCKQCGTKAGEEAEFEEED